MLRTPIFFLCVSKVGRGTLQCTHISLIIFGPNRGWAVVSAPAGQALIGDLHAALRRAGLTASILVKYEPTWQYDDETKWPGHNCKEGGRRQSPIDIKIQDVIKDYEKKFIKYGPLKFTGYKKVLVTGINNGYTVQFSTEGEEAIHPIMTGGPLQHKYRLEQMHFHWLSEHSIDEVKFPMEIHYVHVRNDLTVLEALGQKDGLAIVAVFCNVQTELGDDQQEASEEVMQHIPQLTKTGDRVSGILMDMSKLLKTDTIKYFTYYGSLTSPECNEAVVWIIFQTPVTITDDQYRHFSKIGVGRHNFRSLQKLRTHRVYTPATNKLNTPKIISFFEDVVNAFTGFFRNITTYISHGLKTH